MLALLREALDGGALAAAAVVDDVVEPAGKLDAHVGDVSKRATIEKRPLDLPERTFGARLFIGMPATHGERTEFVRLEKARKLRQIPTGNTQYLRRLRSEAGA